MFCMNYTFFTWYNMHQLAFWCCGLTPTSKCGPNLEFLTFLTSASSAWNSTLLFGIFPSKITFFLPRILNFTPFSFLLTCSWLQKAGFLYWGFWCKTLPCTKYGNILNGKKCTLGMIISNRKFKAKNPFEKKFDKKIALK